MIKGRMVSKKKFKAVIDNVRLQFNHKAEKAVQLSTLAVHAETIKLIRARSAGERMIRYSPKRTVTVSKPGEPPNSDTGRLIQSMKFEFEGLKGFVGSNLRYAAHLEFGTETMEPRPFLSTAVKNSEKRIQQIFTKELNKAVKESSK